MSKFWLSAYTGDDRGGKIESAWKRELADGSASENFLDLCCPQAAVDQIMACFGSSGHLVDVPGDLRTTVSHSIYFAAGHPSGLRELVYLLKDVVSIPAPVGVDFSVALDWYKHVAEGVEPRLWTDTPMAQCIHFTKYATYPSGTTSRAKRAELLRRLSQFIQIHPLYAAAPVITSPPGSAADGQSFAERLAQDVAGQAGKIYVGQRAAGPRPQQKGGVNQDLSEAFDINGTMRGTVIVIDDVYRTGASISGAALAARRGGASSVLALAAVRTLRN
ncbi:hypothetical protein AB4Y87_04610 [Paenarthrobacter sp. RAF54_2]|uniref:hypothetical protein n=1 Tax=Paenarthrobacter sp. RAF54_2 TaxID=3233061 RepID=UPI003F9460FA